ncbi:MULTISPECIES: phosphorylase family protein [unclassified Microcoleus]|uniref:phosphorylase family protein n=1 Tax=unclassified Microcoleus TaxID=2642155 RepID=UPI002FD54C91
MASLIPNHQKNCYSRQKASLYKMETCKVDIAILTVIPQELAAAKAALGIQDISNNRTKTQDSQTIYLHGELFSERTQRNYRVALGCIGSAGNYNSSQAATEVIQTHDPKLLVLVGIAAGIKGKAKLGEVVFSERVLGSHTPHFNNTT